ncbi:MAG: hypothetical protein IPJ94_31360 [Chloroflexi bacterium]|nr:hypothetical protein [Chloroflexota bacterium]
MGLPIHRAIIQSAIKAVLFAQMVHMMMEGYHHYHPPFLGAPLSMILIGSSFMGLQIFLKKTPTIQNGSQHSGLDYGKYAQFFGGTGTTKQNNGTSDGTCGATEEHRLIPVYGYCTVDSTSTGSPYAPGRVNLTHEEYPDFLLIYGHLQDIQVTSGSVTPDTIIGYLDTTERHLHLEIRRISDNHFVNPFPYLSQSLQVEMRSFRGDSSGTTYQPGHSANPAQQTPGY